MNFNFRFLEVHTLHVRDFGGERIIQTLGEIRNFEVDKACAQSELQAFIYPAKKILLKTFPFIILLIVGIILSLTLSLKSNIFALQALGIIAALTGLSGIISECRKIFAQRKILMNSDKALEISALQCALKTAPKKYNENDLTYIPINNETKNATLNELAMKYNLLPAISEKALNLMRCE